MTSSATYYKSSHLSNMSSNVTNHVDDSSQPDVNSPWNDRMYNQWYSQHYQHQNYQHPQNHEYKTLNSSASFYNDSFGKQINQYSGTVSSDIATSYDFPNSNIIQQYLTSRNDIYARQLSDLYENRDVYVKTEDFTTELPQIKSENDEIKERIISKDEKLKYNCAIKSEYYQQPMADYDDTFSSKRSSTLIAHPGSSTTKPLCSQKNFVDYSRLSTDNSSVNQNKSIDGKISELSSSPEKSSCQFGSGYPEEEKNNNDSCDVNLEQGYCHTKSNSLKVPKVESISSAHDEINIYPWMKSSFNGKSFFLLVYHFFLSVKLLFLRDKDCAIYNESAMKGLKCVATLIFKHFYLISIDCLQNKR